MSDTGIIVVGVGGGGINAVNLMIEEKVEGVDFIGIDNDEQALERCRAKKKLRISEKLTKGAGAFKKHEFAGADVKESMEEISEVIKDAEMVFIICGMGGGTGSGAAPVIAKLSKEQGILTIGVVTKPFRFEAKARKENAVRGIERMKSSVDTLIEIPNDRILQIADKKGNIDDVLKLSDSLLQLAVQGITDLIAIPALINIDIEDIRMLLRDKGMAEIAFRSVKGKDCTLKAVQELDDSSYLEEKIKGASDILVSITGDFSLMDINEAMDHIQSIAGESVNLVFGAKLDENTPEEIMIVMYIMKGESDVESM